MDESPHSNRLVTRRQAVAAAGFGIGGLLAGCLGGASDAAQGSGAAETPAPVDLAGGKEDDQGGMIIGEHFGPNGQIFYAENAPEGHDNPAWFHTLATGFFPYHFERDHRGWTAVAMYVTDYSLVEYDLVTQDGETHVSSHTAPETFAPARDVRYVAGSDVLGGMGAELIPFSNDDDVDRFTGEHGGRAVSFEDVDAEFLADVR